MVDTYRIRKAPSGLGLRQRCRASIVAGMCGVLLAGGAGAERLGPEGDELGPVRTFQAFVVSVDGAAKTVRMRHKPTGFVASATWDADTQLGALLQYDIDEVPEGWVECWCAAIDQQNHVLRDAASVQPLPSGAKPPEQGDGPKAKTTFRGVLRRLPGRYVGAPADRLLTAKRDAAYYIEVNGERWELRCTKRPSMTRATAVTWADLRPGTACDEMSYRETPRGNRLLRLHVVLNQHFVPSIPGGPTGLTAARFGDEMREARERQAHIAGALRRLMPVSMAVTPELASRDERITLRMEAWGSHSPNPVVELEPSYLRRPAGVREALHLVWKPSGVEYGLTRYAASCRLPVLPVGQHIVRWKCDIGGDVDEFWRSFAVTGPRSMVAMIHCTTSSPSSALNAYRLPYDYWESGLFQLIGGPFATQAPLAAAEPWAAISREHRRRGADPNFTIFQGYYTAFRSWPFPVPVEFRSEPPDVQRAVLRGTRELAAMAGFSDTGHGFVGYEFGTAAVNAAREAGVRMIASLCAHQNYMDGSWGINLRGRPLRPYYASRDDHRKPAARSKDDVVMVSQLTKSLLFGDYMFAAFEPCWIEEAWCSGGGGGRKEIDDVFMSRDYDVFEGQIQNLANQRVPLFLDLGIEGFPFGVKPNELFLAYVVRRAASSDIVFCNQTAAADYYRRHYRTAPETVDYEPDCWCGLKAYSSAVEAWKPVAYPDQIQIENSRFSAIFHRPEVLPQYHWDYAQQWSYPDWGNERLPRSVWGTLVPGEHDRFAVTPKITDTRAIRVTRQMRDGPSSLDVTVTLYTPRPLASFPLALWNLPRAWRDGSNWWSVGRMARFVPIRAFFTGNLCGVLVVDARPGANVYHLRIRSARRAPVSQDLAVTGAQAKVFVRDGTPMAYLWPARPWDTAVELRVPAGRAVQYYAAPDGERVDLAPGAHRLVIAKERWSRIVGLTRDELSRALSGAPAQQQSVAP